MLPLHHEHEIYSPWVSHGFADKGLIYACLFGRVSAKNFWCLKFLIATTGRWQEFLVWLDVLLKFWIWITFFEWETSGILKFVMLELHLSFLKENNEISNSANQTCYKFSLCKRDVAYFLSIRVSCTHPFRPKYLVPAFDSYHGLSNCVYAIQFFDDFISFFLPHLCFLPRLPFFDFITVIIEALFHQLKRAPFFFLFIYSFTCTSCNRKSFTRKKLRKQSESSYHVYDY